MALALLVAAGTETFAQAAKKKEPLRFMGLAITVVPNPLAICVGKSTWLLIESREVWGRPSSKSVIRSQPVGVLATVTSNTNPEALKLARLEPNPFEPYPGERFNLTGVKAGKGQITFTVIVSGARPGQDSPFELAPFEFKVVDCDYKVGQVLILGSPVFHSDLVIGTVADVRVAPDDEGRLSGHGEVAWVDALQDLPDCKSRSSVKPSGVDVTGEVGDDGLVRLDLTYEAIEYEHVVTRCANPNDLEPAISFSFEPPPVSPVVPVEGGSVQAHRTVKQVMDVTVVTTVEPVSEPEVASAETSVAQGSLAVLARQASER